MRPTTKPGGDPTNPHYPGALLGWIRGGYERQSDRRKPSSGEIDRFDRALLDVLGTDGRITVTDLAQRIGLSKTPTQVRLRRLIDEGVTLGFCAVIDPTRLGLDHVAFAEVKLSDTREQARREFNAAVRRIAEVEECHMIASSFDYLVKVRTPDIRRYRFVRGEKIYSLPHVASTSTFVAMETVRDDTR